MFVINYYSLRYISSASTSGKSDLEIAVPINAQKYVLINVNNS